MNSQNSTGANGQRTRWAPMLSVVLACLGILTALAPFVILGGVPLLPWLIVAGTLFTAAALTFPWRARWFAAIIGVAVVLMAAASVHRTIALQAHLRDEARERRIQPIDLPHLSIGAFAPDIQAKNLIGEEMTLSEHRGNVVLLVFWASWCGPCIADVAHEKELVGKFRGRPFTIVGVNADKSIANAQRAVDKHAIPWRSFWNGSGGGNGPITDHWGIQAWPTTYIIDDRGVIQHKGLRNRSLDQPLERLISLAEERSKSQIHDTQVKAPKNAHFALRTSTADEKSDASNLAVKDFLDLKNPITAVESDNTASATDHENTPTTLAPPRDTLVGETTHINGTFLQAAKANRDAAAGRLARQLADVKLALTLYGDTVRDGAMAKSALRQFFDRDMEYREAQLEQLGKRIERSAAKLEQRQSARDELIDLQLRAFKMDAEGLGLTTKRIPARSTPTQSTPAVRNSDGARRAGVGATAAPVTVSGAFKADPTALFPVGDLDAQIRVRFQALAEAKGDEQKAKALNSLRTALRKYFDADMKARLASLESLKEELAELRVRHKTRAESKDEIIELQLKLFINEANGLGFFSKIEPKETHPNLDGRWKLVSLIQDEQKTPVEKLKGAYVDIKDNLMVFHVPSKPDFPDLHIKYQFAAKGIDLQITDSREQDYAGPTFDGQWSLKDQQFKFACWNTSETQKVRPPLAHGKSVIYVELERIRPSR